jgi:hypothetical protein
MRFPKMPRGIVLAGTGAILALTIPASASAGVLVSDAPSCDTQTFAQPFLPWADPASYTLDPGGSFEPGQPAWSLSGAKVVAGNEPENVTSADDARSLDIGSGGAAVSPPICVGIEHPDLRFFARASNPSATLKVEVLFEDAAGNVRALQIGAVTGNTGWAPTAMYPLVANLLPLLPGSHTAVSFRFTASGGCFRIDDVYVDPYSRW